MDRRVRKSNDALKIALKKLMAKTAVDKISITRLCQEADLNRSTFYDHYLSVEDLLSEIHGEYFKTMDLMLDFSEEFVIKKPLDNMRSLINFLDDCRNKNSQFRFFLLNSPNHLFERNIQSYYINKLYTSEIDHITRYAFLYHSTASLMVIQQWILDDCPCSAEELAHQIYSLSTASWPYTE